MTEPAGLVSDVAHLIAAGRTPAGSAHAILEKYDLVEKGAVPCVEVRLTAPYNGEPDVLVNVSGWAVDDTGQLNVFNREGKTIARYRSHAWLTVVNTFETDSEAIR